eukprot:329247-Pelagomonas_calceolata.AAC.4
MSQAGGNHEKMLNDEIFHQVPYSYCKLQSTPCPTLNSNIRSIGLACIKTGHAHVSSLPSHPPPSPSPSLSSSSSSSSSIGDKGDDNEDDKEEEHVHALASRGELPPPLGAPICSTHTSNCKFEPCAGALTPSTGRCCREERASTGLPGNSHPLLQCSSTAASMLIHCLSQMERGMHCRSSTAPMLIYCLSQMERGIHCSRATYPNDGQQQGMAHDLCVEVYGGAQGDSHEQAQSRDGHLQDELRHGRRTRMFRIMWQGAHGPDMGEGGIRRQSLGNGLLLTWEKSEVLRLSGIGCECSLACKANLREQLFSAGICSSTALGFPGCYTTG